MVNQKLVIIYNKIREGKIPTIHVWVMINQQFISGELLSDEDEEARNAAARPPESPGDALAYKLKIDEIVDQIARPEIPLDDLTYIRVYDASILTPSGVRIVVNGVCEINLEMVAAWGFGAAEFPSQA